MAVATRSPAPARPVKVSLRAPHASARWCTSANTLPAAAPAAFGPRAAAAADASAAAFLAQAASSAPTTSSWRSTVSPAVGEHLRELPGEVGVSGGQHHGRPALGRLACVRRAGRVATARARTRSLT